MIFRLISAQTTLQQNGSFLPMGGSIASNGWKGCFQWVERLFPMGRSNASNEWKQKSGSKIPLNFLIFK